MQFSDYLKLCRSNNTFTQEELVHALYHFDEEHFKGLDTTTLSKWERGITQPKLTKQVSIIKYFQDLTHMAFPYLDTYTEQEIEKHICDTVVHSIIANSKSKELILNFPSSQMSPERFNICQLKDSAIMDKVIKINTYLDKNFNQDSSDLTAENFKKWALFPGNFFIACEYGEEVIGLFFVLKLKPEVFDKVINGTLREIDLEDDHFALPSEKGSSYILSFFALNEKAASMMIVRYYAHLVTHQVQIDEVGVSTLMKDAQKLIENINLPYHTSCIINNDMELQFFKASLSCFLATPNVVKMLLSNQECKEE